MASELGLYLFHENEAHKKRYAHVDILWTTVWNNSIKIQITQLISALSGKNAYLHIQHN